MPLAASQLSAASARSTSGRLHWSDDDFLQRESPLGWGPETPKYLDPTTDHKWHILPPEYTWHMETTTWSITPRQPSDFEALNLERPPPPPLMVLSG